MPDGPPRFPLLRIMLGNATLLSLVYLGAAVVVDGVRRLYNPRWSERASLAMESLPARVLELLGLMGPLRRGYVYGAMNELTVRMVFGATTILIIFALAIFVGAGMWGLRALWERRIAR